MVNGQRAVSVVWRTVVCAAIAPACRHDAAKPKEPEPDEVIAEDEPDGEDDAPREDPGCGYLDTSSERPRDWGDQEDGILHLLITTEPPGALVHIDGEDAPRGKTPLDVELPVMMYNRVYSLDLEGYDSDGSILDQGVDRDVAWHFDLVPEGTRDARPRCPGEENEHWDIGFVVS